MIQASETNGKQGQAVALPPASERLHPGRGRTGQGCRDQCGPVVSVAAVLRAVSAPNVPVALPVLSRTPEPGGQGKLSPRGLPGVASPQEPGPTSEASDTLQPDPPWPWCSGSRAWWVPLCFVLPTCTWCGWSCSSQQATGLSRSSPGPRVPPAPSRPREPGAPRHSTSEAGASGPVAKPRETTPAAQGTVQAGQETR